MYLSPWVALPKVSFYRLRALAESPCVPGPLTESLMVHTWWPRKDTCPFSCYKTSLSQSIVTGLMVRMKFIFISPGPLMCEVKNSKENRICQWPSQVLEVSAGWQ